MISRRTLFARLLSALAAVPLMGKALKAKPTPGYSKLLDTFELTELDGFEGLRRFVAPHLTPQQQALIDCPAREILFYGGRGSGRTFGARRWASGSRRSIFLTAEQFNRINRRDEEFLRSLDYRDRIVIDNAENIESEDFYDAFVNRYPFTRICLTANPAWPSKAWITLRFFGVGGSLRAAIPSGTIFDNPALRDVAVKWNAGVDRNTKQAQDEMDRFFHKGE